MRGLEAIDRIRTFVLEGGYKAAILGAFVSHWCCWIVMSGFFSNPGYWQDGLLLGYFGMVIQAIFAIPSYYLLKFVVPSAYQKGLYHFVAGFIAALVLPLLVWWAYF